MNSLADDDIVEWMTLSVVGELGYEQLLEYCEINLGCDTFTKKASIPIGYSKIDNRFPGSITISKEVDLYIQQVVKPMTDKGVEVPYFILGTFTGQPDNMIVTLDKIVNCIDLEKLNYCEAVFPKTSISQMKEIISAGQYSVAVIGHSHPFVANNKDGVEPEYENLINYLRTVKNENGYRDGNLNLTLKDIYSLVQFSLDMKDVNKSILTMQSVYHNNGELNFVACDDEFYLSFVADVYHMTDTNLLEPVPNFDNNKQKER